MRVKSKQGVLLIQTCPSVLCVQAIPCVSLSEHMFIEMVHTDLRVLNRFDVSNHLGTYVLYLIRNFRAALLEAFEKTVPIREILK